MITAIIVCVDYADFLAITLPATVAAVDRVCVATAPHDEATLAVCRANNVEITVYPRFSGGEATFDKAGGLNFLLDRLQPQGWVLSLDADIFLPRQLEANGLDRSHLYAAHRRMIAEPQQWREYLASRDLTPFARYGPGLKAGRAGLLGYFQLWHYPTFPQRRFPSSCNAAGYDKAFGRLWPRPDRCYVEGDVVHLGINKANWNGRVTEAWPVSKAAVGNVGFG
jgi:hypothetical protein